MQVCPVHATKLVLLLPFASPAFCNIWGISPCSWGDFGILNESPEVPAVFCGSVGVSPHGNTLNCAVHVTQSLMQECNWRLKGISSPGSMESWFVWNFIQQSMLSVYGLRIARLKIQFFTKIVDQSTQHMQLDIWPSRSYILATHPPILLTWSVPACWKSRKTYQNGVSALCKDLKILSCAAFSSVI